MSRWKVERGNSWDGPCWFVFDPDGRYITNRFDWAEALAYADRMARTREVVLPRQLNTKRPVGTTKKYWEVAPHVGTQNVLIRRRREDGHICQQITVNRKDLGLLAPMLLTALAEQEERA